MKKYLIVTSISLAIITVCFCIYIKISTPKIAYIRSAVIVEGYLGVKEAKILYQKKTEKWQENMDVLSSDMNHSIRMYKRQYTSWNPQERQEKETSIETQRLTLEKHQAAIEVKAQAEEEKLMQGALNQINSFIEKYAHDHGYTVVLGTTQSGNILYASESIDITDEVLKALNQSYK